MRHGVALLLVAVLSMALATPANASVIWDGDASRGVYGASGTTVTNFVDGLKVRTTRGDVDD